MRYNGLWTKRPMPYNRLHRRLTNSGSGGTVKKRRKQQGSPIPCFPAFEASKT
jgi:hypothetical protein